MCCSILHNLLIKEPIPDDWDLMNNNDNSDDNTLDDEDELNRPAEQENDQRRMQIIAHILENFR